MKKVSLLLFGTLVCSLVQASVVQWGAMRITDNGVAVTGMTALSYMVEAGTDMTSTWAAIASGTAPSSIEGFGSSYEIVRAGNVPMQELANYNDHNGYTPSTNYDVYLVVIDGDRFTYTDAKTITTPAWIETNEQYVNAQFGVVNLTDEDWHSIVSIPEPTVLALLALGVAGMALRRKM